MNQISSIKKILVLLDGIQGHERKAIMQKLRKETCLHEFFMISECAENPQGNIPSTLYLKYCSVNNISNFFSQQLIGTTLFVIGEDKFILQMKRYAYESGFTDQEIQTYQIGNKKDQVFCVKCYKLLSKNHVEELTCVYCQTLLQISKHFSKRHNAFLGYIKIG